MKYLRGETAVPLTLILFCGKLQVCQCKLWDKVYNEVLDADMVYEGTSSAARFFYQK